MIVYSIAMFISAAAGAGVGWAICAAVQAYRAEKARRRRNKARMYELRRNAWLRVDYPERPLSAIWFPSTEPETKTPIRKATGFFSDAAAQELVR